ncbi:uncharacterized protein LOC117175025 [Belonocnema kinseyi]|uniref:uncharacterized protein LOC117175025 n=1 Tax=Belonocnema kinseyi TaxID=2817044 RepID=UPI00143D5CF5|nr:uncharacterized protein LOC117175025 [Belonocnema kinseyi]
MSYLRMNDITKVARKLFQRQLVFYISHRENVSKTFQRDNKVLCGKLMETLSQKRKRLKLEKKGKIVSTPKEGSTNWQEYFLFKNSKKNVIKVVSSPKNNPQLKKKEGIGDAIKESKFKECKSKETPKEVPEFFDLVEMEDVNLKSFSNSSTGESQLEVPAFTKKELKYESRQESLSSGLGEIKNENAGRIVSKNVIPSQIIVKNMLSFSIFDSTKSARVTHKTTRDINDIISFSPSEDSSNLILPSVTRILSATMSEASKKALAIWKEGMIQKLGREVFDAYQKDLFKDGHDLHSSIESRLLQKEYEIPERVKPAFKSVENVLKEIQSVTALETHVVHPKLNYRGITDCVATYRDELCLIDWKKSDKRKDTISSVYDAPIQVASYVGALNADLKYPFEIKKGLVVVAYTSGEEASVYELVQEDLFIYWKAWLRRLQKYFVELKK